MNTKYLMFAFSVLLAASSAAEDSVEKRIANREYPSVFQAWNEATNLNEDKGKAVSRHDLFFGMLGDQWEAKYEGEGNKFTPESLKWAKSRKEALLKLNPNMIFIREVRYRDAPSNYLPEASAYWMREKNGKRKSGWEEGGYYLLDFTKTEYRAIVAEQAKAAVINGIYDGVMLDWWGEPEEENRLELLKGVREAIGKDALIIVNAGDKQIPKSAKYVNGIFFEGFYGGWWSDWQIAKKCLTWAEKNLRAPRVNCFETWYKDEKLKRNELDAMRAATAMVLTLSDGYVLFGDPNPLPTPDHLHDWYSFWNKSLGKRVSAPAEKRNDNGTYSREFEKGTVVYNPPDNENAVVKFKENRRSVADGSEAVEFVLKAKDGGIYVKK